MNITRTEPDIYEESKLKDSVKGILDSNFLCSYATINENKSHIATAYFSYTDLNKLYILTPPNSQHAKNVEQNNTIAVAIFDSNQDPDDKKQGLQMFGTMAVVKDKEIGEALLSYSKRFISFAKEITNVKSFLDLFGERFYVMNINKIKIFDEATFGTETWVEIYLD